MHSGLEGKTVYSSKSVIFWYYITLTLMRHVIKPDQQRSYAHRLLMNERAVYTETTKCLHQRKKKGCDVVLPSLTSESFEFNCLMR